MSGSRRKPGPLGPFVEGYRAWLFGRGYSPSVVVGSLVTLGHLGRWLERNSLAVGQLTDPAVSSFVAEYRLERGRLPGASVWALLAYLRAEGAVAAEPPAVVAPLEQLLERTAIGCSRARVGAGYGPRERSGSPAASSPAASAAGPLWRTRGHGRRGQRVPLRECARVSTGSAGCCTSRLRSLLRYLAVRGFAEPELRGMRFPESRAGARRRSRSSRRDRRSTGSSARCDRGKRDRRARLRDPAAARAAGVAVDRGRATAARRSRLARRGARRRRQGPPPRPAAAARRRRRGAVRASAASRPQRGQPARVLDGARRRRGRSAPSGCDDRPQRLPPGRDRARAGAHRLRHALASELLRAGRVADRHQPGAAPQAPGHHRDLRQGRPRSGCATSRCRGRERLR